MKVKSLILFSLLLIMAQQAYASEQVLNDAMSLFKSGKYMEARRLFQDAYLVSKKGAVAESALLGVAKSDYHLKRYYESRQNLNRVLSMTQNPDIKNETNYYLGLVALSLHNYRFADRYLSNVSGLLKPAATIAMAEAALRLNQVAQAEVLINSLKPAELELNPRGVAVKAMVESLKGRHERAVSLIKRVNEKSLKDLDMAVEKAQILYYADRLKEAESQINKILNSPDTTNINRLRALRVLWFIYNKEEKVDDAIKIGNLMLAYENSDDFKVKLARLYDKKGEMANSFRVLSFIESKRTKEQEFEKRMKTIIAEKDPLATSYIYKYGNFVSQNSPLLIDMARHLVAQNDKKAAIEMLRRASMGASAGAASMYMAELLLQEKRFTEAKRALDYLTLDPRYARSASMLLGEIIEMEGNIAGAINYYKKVFDATKDPRLAERIGDILWKRGSRDEAASYYVFASSGGNLSASVKAGDYYYIKGDRRTSSEYYKRALNISKDKPEYAWVNYQYGKIAGSKEHLANAATSGKGEFAEAARILLREF